MRRHCVATSSMNGNLLANSSARCADEALGGIR
jgi:hypothetical protein